MKIKDITPSQFQKDANYICTLCGYPSVAPDKLEIMLTFLKDHHGWNDIEELVKAYEALAAGRLEEKMDSFKSMNGMHVSRVIQAYMRSKKTNENGEKSEIGFLSDDCQDVLFNKTGRRVTMKADLSQSDKDLLMDYWIGENMKVYKDTRSLSTITATSYDYLIRKGILRENGGNIEYSVNGGYHHLVTMDACKRGGEELSKSDKKGFTTKTIQKISWGSIGEPWKRYAVACYFEIL